MTILSASAGTGLRLRPMTSGDEAFVKALVFDVKGAMFAPLGLAPDVLGAMLLQQFHARDAGYRHAYPDAQWLVAEQAGVAVGHMILAQDNVASPMVFRIVDFIVAPEARQQGIGRKMLLQAADSAKATGAERIALVVALTNRLALRLYEQAGFMATGVPVDGMFLPMELRLS